MIQETLHVLKELFFCVQRVCFSDYTIKNGTLVIQICLFLLFAGVFFFLHSLFVQKITVLQNTFKNRES